MGNMGEPLEYAGADDFLGQDIDHEYSEIEDLDFGMSSGQIQEHLDDTMVVSNIGLTQSVELIGYTTCSGLARNFECSHVLSILTSSYIYEDHQCSGVAHAQCF